MSWFSSLQSRLAGFSLSLPHYHSHCLQGAHAAERRRCLHPQAGRCQLVWRRTSWESWHFPHNLCRGDFLHLIWCLQCCAVVTLFQISLAVFHRFFRLQRSRLLSSLPLYRCWTTGKLWPCLTSMLIYLLNFPFEKWVLQMSWSREEKDFLLHWAPIIACIGVEL